MSVWVDVVGQPDAVETLSRAVSIPAAMTHAWLFTDPPGSGPAGCSRGDGGDAPAAAVTGDGPAPTGYRVVGLVTVVGPRSETSVSGYRAVSRATVPARPWIVQEHA